MPARLTRCRVIDCPAEVDLSSRWPKTRAHRAGWYLFRDGTVCCPDHRPSWAPPVKERSS